jgi:hypothetical protein
VPLPSGLVEKNGSQIRSRLAGVIPGPESVNSTLTPTIPLSDSRDLTRVVSVQPCPGLQQPWERVLTNRNAESVG